MKTFLVWRLQICYPKEKATNAYKNGEINRQNGKTERMSNPTATSLKLIIIGQCTCEVVYLKSVYYYWFYISTGRELRSWRGTAILVW